MAEELDSGSKDHPKLSGKISGKEQMALNYIGFFSHMHMKFKQFRQKKKKKKGRVNGTLSFFCDRKVLAFLFDVFMSVYIFWDLCMALCGSSGSQDCALQSMGVGHVGM